MRGAIAFQLKGVARAPELKEQHQSSHRGYRGEDIGQAGAGEFGADVVRYQELHAAERDSAKNRGGQDAPQGFPASHRKDQIGRDEEGHRSTETAHPAAQLQQR